MRSIPVLILFFASSTLLAQPPAGYYDPAAGLSGAALRSALYGIINDHTILANSQLWDAFQAADQKQDGTVWDIYSDVPGGSPAYSFQFVTDQCGTYSGEGDCFNREHTFPQSWFNSGMPMSTDVFHIYPTDAWVNQKRANWPYAPVNAPTWTGTNGSKLGPCNYPGCSGTAFEPIDAYKGDVARGYFYMMTRYLPDLASWPSPMMTNGDISPWAAAMLIGWHQQDPVSPKEFDRNNAVFGLQGNRNPYIDHPEWVEPVFSPLASVEDRDVEQVRMWWADEVLHLRTDQDLAGSVLRIIDPTGRLIFATAPRNASTDLVLQLEPGTYVALLERKGRRSALRFVR